MSDESEESSSYEETESSSDCAWTCDDIYPTTTTDQQKKLKSEEGAADNKEESSSEEEASTTDDSAAGKRQPPSRHSSGEIEIMLKSQEQALKTAHDEEQKRRLMVSEARNLSKEKNDQAISVSTRLDKEFQDVSREYDTSDENMRATEQKLTNKRNEPKRAQSSMEKTRFEQRNLEREMRLAKARERIERKKEEQQTKAATEEKAKEQPQKLDMSKSARVERAYSWYTRMAMPNREKMKERVQFMPASAGVTPDDVDLLPWNARGTFVSVAAMMRMNRTGFLNETNKASTSSGAVSNEDSDADSD